MKLEAAIMVRINVPFDFAVETIDVSDPQDPNSTTVAESRIAAGKYAETTLVDALTNAISDQGEIVESVVEEVREL